MEDLNTNYVDDVLDSSKNQLRKYQQIQNDDGTVSFVDVTEYTTTGTSFGAKDINDTNAAVNELNNSLGVLSTPFELITTITNFSKTRVAISDYDEIVFVCSSDTLSLTRTQTDICHKALKVSSALSSYYYASSSYAYIQVNIDWDNNTVQPFTFVKNGTTQTNGSAIVEVYGRKYK